MTAYEVAHTESDPFHWHQLLEEKVERLRELCGAQASEPGWLSTVSAEFEEFVDALVAHFEAEESLRHFKDLPEAQPELKDRVEDLIADHRAMILLLEQIRDAMLAAAPPQKITTELQRLLEAFAAHERTEMAVVQAAYGDE